MMDHNEYDIIRSPSNHATFKRAPSLPRLRNKASLGRLQVFGGVLDFDDEGGRSANSSSMDYIPPIPVLSHLYCSNLAGPVHSSSIHHTHTTPTESHNNKQQTEGEDEELQHTPVKNTNTLSALKAVKAMNRQDKYPSSLSNGLPPSSSSSAATIPRLDFDHPQGQSQSEIRHKQEQSRCNINIINGHSRSSSSRRTSQHHYKNASSLDSFSDESSATGANVGEGRRRRITRPSLSSQDEIEEKENLVNEINKDMDEGGYASLEQVSF